VSQLSPRFFRRLSRERSTISTNSRTPAAQIPALLVSVRHPLEARAAVAGGCDLLDIKEPARGPLGMADPGVISAISQFAAGCRGTATPLPCSAAMGELAQWLTRPPEISLPRGISYVKLGPAGLDTPALWVEAWQQAQKCLAPSPHTGLRWVAVAYADWRAAKALEPSRLLEVACSVRCDVLLIDTFDKGSGNLLRLLDGNQLRRLSDSAHRSGLKIALAGGLQRGQLSDLLEIGPDIIGVRGTACAGGRRTAPVSAKAVRALKRELIASFTAERESLSGA
jgi:(5-formylfuran-3-yl)methyl phosphate synthase